MPDNYPENNNDNRNQNHDPRQNPNQRRGFRFFLPFILIAAVVVTIIVLFSKNIFNRTITWSKSELYNLLRVNSAENTTSTVYLYTANVSQSYTTTTVSGTALLTNAKTSYKYTVSMENEEWSTNKFEANMFTEKNAEGVYVVLATPNKELVTWSEVFQDRIREWNASPDLSRRFSTPAYYLVTDAFQTSWLETWGPTLLLLLGTIILGIFFFSRINNSVNGANRQAMDFNRSPARREDSSKTKFDDVAGCDEEKQEMVELVEYLKNPKKFSAFGAKLPKGVLLIGPPGTGKTLLAKAVAGEAGVPFFSISGSDFVEMFVGVGAGRVRDLFKKAKQAAPCIVFIDEIDAVGRQRGAGLGGGNDEREQTLNQLLVEMDGFEHNKGILVIAATNRDDVLDPALLRPGRFDRIITVSAPDVKGREDIFKVHARGKNIDPSVDFAALAKRTVGFSGADIANILNEAAILAVRFGKESIGMPEIDEAIDRQIAGPAKNSKRMNEHERRQVAYHEAGHAVIGLVLPHSEKVQKITIIPRGQTGGHVLMTPETDRFLLTKKELLAEITGLLGGRTSEEIFFDDVSTGAENDIQRATRLARMMVTEFGMSELGPIQYESNQGSVFLGRDYTNTSRNFSGEVAFEIDKAVRKIIEDAHEQAKAILTEHKKDVTLIAETLLENETITAEQIDALIKTGALPQKQIETVHQIDGAIPEQKEEAPKEETPKE